MTDNKREISDHLLATGAERFDTMTNAAIRRYAVAMWDVLTLGQRAEIEAALDSAWIQGATK